MRLCSIGVGIQPIHFPLAEIHAVIIFSSSFQRWPTYWKPVYIRFKVIVNTKAVEHLFPETRCRQRCDRYIMEMHSQPDLRRMTQSSRISGRTGRFCHAQGTKALMNSVNTEKSIDDAARRTPVGRTECIWRRAGHRACSSISSRFDFPRSTDPPGDRRVY